MKHRKPLPHFCNEPLRCPECIQRFWIWAESHTMGRRGPRDDSMANRRGGDPDVPSFYEAAGKR